MNLSGLLPLIESITALGPALERRAGESRLVLGLPDTAKAATLAALARRLTAPLLVLAARPDRARALAEELAVWLGDDSRVALFPERDPLPYERLAPDMEAVAQRLRVLSLLADAEPAPVIVASAQAAAQRTLAPAELARATETLAVGSRLASDDFLRRLALRGYRFLPLVEEAGQASRRGGIIDIFPPTADAPARIELVGDRIESLRLFDPASQRSVAKAESISVGPAREIILPPAGPDDLRRGLDFARCSPDVAERFQEEISTLAVGGAFAGDSFYVPLLAQGTLLDFLPTNALLVCDEPSEVAAALDELEAQALEVRAEMEAKGELPADLPLPHLTWRELEPRLDGAARRVDLSRWATGEDGSVRLPFEAAPAYGGRLRNVVSEAIEGRRSGRRCIIVSQQAARLADLFAEQDVSAEPSAAVAAAPPPGGLAVVQGSLPGGWILSEPSNVAEAPSTSLRAGFRPPLGTQQAAPLRAGKQGRVVFPIRSW
jgi:transcription-repair coupling factor (superfamily II helicase)